MKSLIGIDEANKGHLLGNLVVAIVVADRQFFREHTFLPIRDSKTLTRNQRDKIVRHTKDKVLHWKVKYIKPHIIATHNLNDLMAEAIVELLNTQREFWKHEIHIDNYETTRQAFVDRMDLFLPSGLKKIKEELKIDKWNIEHAAESKYRIVSLASIYAKHFSDLEYDEMRAIYGEIGSGNANHLPTLKFLYDNLDNPPPIIRTSFKTFANLKLDPNEKEKLKQRLIQEGLIKP